MDMVREDSPEQFPLQSQALIFCLINDHNLIDPKPEFQESMNYIKYGF